MMGGYKEEDLPISGDIGSIGNQRGLSFYISTPI
jgi:hypothetical protein